MPQPRGSSYSQSYTVTVKAPAAQIEAILINGSTGPVSIELPEENAGAVIGQVTVTTKSGQAYTDPLWLGGDDGGWFQLSNGGIAPCELRVGQGDIPPDTYAITINAA